MASTYYVRQILGNLFTCYCGKYYKNAEIKSVQFSETQCISGRVLTS